MDYYLTALQEYLTVYSNYVNSAAGGNEFLAASISLSVTAILGYILHTLPRRLWSFILKQSTVELTITSKDSAYDFLMSILNKDGTLTKSRYFNLSDSQVSSDKGAGPIVSLLNTKKSDASSKSLGSGIQYLKLLDIWCKVDSSSDTLKDSIIYSLTITHLGRKSRFINKLHELQTQSKKEFNLFEVRDIEDYKTIELIRRPFNKSTLDNSTIKVFDKVVNFYKEEARYLKYDIPFHLGVLLHGAPGTGKSRVIKAMLSDLTSIGYRAVYAKGISNLFSNIENNTVVVMEEVDSFLVNRDDDNESLTNQTKEQVLFQLLQAMDGILSCHNVIFIMTTNKIKCIDKALMRPGRLDVVHEIPFVTGEVFDEFLKHYYDFVSCNIHTVKDNLTGASLLGGFNEGLSVHEFISKFTLY
jgi:chaperone BCS1